MPFFLFAFSASLPYNADMRQSQLFGKTIRESPKDEVAENAKLLERGGFVYKTMAGVYDYLPLGLRVLENIKKIVREEMNAIGGQEMLTTTLQPKERWEKTGRWQELGEEVMYQFKDRSGRDLGIAATHEEPLTEIALRSISSYKDLPLYVYQIQTKFRDELRAKSGLLRGREFPMKDLYSFHADEADLAEFYSRTIDRAYKNIFKRCALDVYVAEASGGAFTKQVTHEYQVLNDAGEDIIFYCTACRFAQNKEVASMTEETLCPKCKGEVKKARGIEVGNIFPLGTKYSEPLGLYFQQKDGTKKPVVMGSYGIGVSRVMATIVETHRDDRGIVWPESVSPFRAHIIELPGRDEHSAAKVKKAALDFHRKLLAKGIEVLYDDRDEKSAGEKFADADLLGIPWRAVISEKTIEKKGVEVKKRTDKEGKIVSEKELIRKLT